MKNILILFISILAVTINCLGQNNLSNNDKLRIRAAYYIATDNDSAKQDIKKLMRSDPNDYQNILLEGSYYKKKNPELAKRNFQKASSLCNCSEALNCLASSYVNSQSGKYDSVIQILKKSIKINPNQPVVYATIGNYYFYEAINDSALIDSARTYDKKAYLLDTTNIPILRQYTFFLKYFYKCSDTTLAYFNRLARLDVKDTVANLYIGLCLLNKKYSDPFKALPYLIKAQQNNPKSANCNFYLANCYAQTFNYSTANGYIKKAISLNSNDSLANIYLDFLVVNTSKCEPYDSLINYLQSGSKLNLPNIIKYKNSVDSANTAINSFKSSGAIDSLTKLSELNYYARNYTQAAIYIDELIKRGVADEVIYMQRATLHIELGQIDQAINFITSKLKVSKSYYLLFLSAVINTQLKHFDLAKENFTKIQTDHALPELMDEINDYLIYIAANSVN